MSAQIIGCPYCGRTDGVFVVRKRPQESLKKFFHSEFSQYKCRGCTLYYCAPMTPDVLQGLQGYFAEFYNNKDRIYEPKKIVEETWRPSPIKDVLRAICRTFRRQHEFPLGRAGEGMTILQARGVKSLLDVGCSYGGFVRTALQSGIQAYGVEPNREVVSLIRERGVNRVVAGFFPAETGPLPSYDAVIFFQVLMYVHDISPEFFRRCKAALNPGGMLLIFGTDPAHRDAPEVQNAMEVPLVVNFTGAEFMRRVAQDAGFSNYEYMPSLGEPTSCFHILSA